MRCTILLLLLLAACARPSGGVDWYDWVAYRTSEGDMRTERKPDDAPVTRQTLIDNFRRIAFDREKFPLGTGPAARQEPIEPFLRKWHAPVRFALIAPPEDQAQLEHAVIPFMTRLAQITGHPIPRVPAQPAPDEPANLFIIYGPDDMFALFRELARRSHSDDADRVYFEHLADFVDRWRFATSPCAGEIYRSSGAEGQRDPKGTIFAGVVVIKRKIPPALLKSCVEEELAQVMGLINDDDRVRPSVFNDDEEFALLTEHDEYLLRILYDDRLERGMSPEVAMPIARQIVAELLPEG